MDREIVDLYLDDIIPNRFQPREVFDEKALQELAISIKEHGVIQPIIVRKIGDKYEIIAGERRYKASGLAGLTKIPAIIRNLDDKETSKVALLENLQREDLTAIEEARTYNKILELDAMTQEDLGKTIGKSQPAIANKLRLLELPDEIQEALLHQKISERHARSLLSLSSSEEQIKMLNKIIDERMTVREVDEEIKNKMLATSGVNNETLETNEYEEDPDMIGISQSPDLSYLGNASSEIDLDLLKNMSTDILSPVNKKVNIDDLLRVNKESTTEEKAKEEEKDYKFVDQQTPVVAPIVEEKTNDDKFDTNLIMPAKAIEKEEDIIEILNKMEATPFEYKPTQNSLKDAVNTVRDAASLVKSKGFNISLDEMDLENIYQIVIKINKNE